MNKTQIKTMWELNKWQRDQFYDNLLLLHNFESTIPTTAIFIIYDGIQLKMSTFIQIYGI